MKFNRSLLILTFISFITIGAYSQTNTKPLDRKQTIDKITGLIYLVNSFYVDTLNMPEFTDDVIASMLKELDPHSAYIKAKDVKRANESLEGSFEGVGLTFQLYKDTILVVGPIPGGPSDKVGIMAGDQIITVDGEEAYGKDIDNQWVMDHLRGKKGTQVVVGIYRKGNDGLIEYEITRDKIPINSLDAAFMLNKNTGYIKLNRFARQSLDEFNEAATMLKKEGMENLILDLRSNTGGYLGTAMSIADEFLPNGKMIVYTEGTHQPRQELKATSAGKFEDGKLVVLINEGSASASEIVSGAIQDWDRGIIIGRRSFGKGLVQRPFPLGDGSQVRLTVARYYTPSGRCIQKPYDDGVEEYYKDMQKRMEHGETFHADSIHFPDSLKYKTKAGRTVYGGGGIMSDIFIPMDTIRYNDLYTSLVRKGVINGFVNDYLSENRETLTQTYPDLDSYIDGFTLSDDDFNTFMENAEAKKIEYTSEELDPNIDFLKLQLKALIGRNIYETGDYFEITWTMDPEINKALEVIDNNKLYKKILQE